MTEGSNSDGLTLVVTWIAPADNGGSAITTYDVRFIKTVDDETDDDNWTVEEDVWTSTTGGALEYTISGLDPSVEYDIQVRAINANGPGPWSALTAATPGNEAPTLTGPTSVPYDENGTGPVATYSAADPEGATIAWSLSGADSDAFSGDAGVLTFNSPPDYEAPADDGHNNVYQVTMRASDGTNTTRRAVTVTVTNVDEAGSVTLSSVQPQVGTPFVATLTDPDGQISATTWVWERSSDETTWTPIGGETAKSYTPVAGDTGNFLRATATYTDGAGSGKSEKCAAPHRVRSAPVTNSAPTFPTSTLDLAVQVNLGAGSDVGAPVTAQDPENDPLTYTLTGPDTACFSIDWISGQITVAPGGGARCADLAKSGPTSRATVYRVTVVATDPSGVSASIPISITVGSSGGGGDATLRSLSLSRVTLRPSFSSSQTGYTASVANTVTRTTVSATPNHAHASVAVTWAAGPPSSFPASPSTGMEVTLVDGENTSKVTVTAQNGTLKTYQVVVTRRLPNGGGGGGGGGGDDSRDLHGNTPAAATRVRLASTAPWASSTAGQINTADDTGYFEFHLPHAGVLVVETTGTTDTVGTVWQAGAEPARAEGGGTGRNFRLSLRVQAGPVVVAVAGATGRYSVETYLVVGYLENPGRDSFQSGIGVLSGWVCTADTVELEIETESGAVERHVTAYGTERLDTLDIYRDVDNGFGLLFNWNRLGDGEHTVVALVDGVELGRATVTVTTLGEEFLHGAAGECVVEDFPSPGERVTLEWQQNQQNFVITGVE